ncbi:LamG-like jellyroll fold domain-containing protein [Ekhidna sp. To15]|uniref:LamG-like jellyroll fold domain-containing protein n=1 Tax=Ekhidna sp. To15 TaxID=3395267 RepID=UPI003F51F5D3
MIQPPKRIISLILLVFALIILIDQTQSINTTVKNNLEFKELDKRTRMDLAARQEFERTKDPNLGIVPKNRLYEAYRIKERMKSQRSGDVLLDAIPGVSWKERGPNNLGGRTRTILIDPNDVSNSTVWAASISGGLWKTTDITKASPDWSSVNDFFDNMAITTIAYDPSNTTTMYFGTGEGFFNVDAVQGNGIWKSTDGGDSWTQLASTITSNFTTCAGTGDCNFLYVNKIVVTASGTVLAATRGNYTNRGGIMRSTDGGTSWTTVLTGLSGQFQWASDIEIGADGDIYASFGIFQNNSIWKSTDDGATWGASEIYTSAADEERIELATAPNNSEYIYALVQEDDNTIKKIMRSTNGGTSWSTLTTPSWCDQNCAALSSDFTRGQAWYDLTLAVDPNDEDVVYIGGVDLLRTTDGGSTWVQMTNWSGADDYPEVHADQHTIVYQPGSSDVIYFGNDGGIYSTNDGSATTPTFDRKEFGYNTSQFYSIAMEPTAYDPGFIGGTQDNGSAKVTNLGIASIVEVTGGDGGFAHIDQDNSDYQFTAFTNANINRSTDGGLTFDNVLANGGGAFINPTDISNADNMFYGGFSAGQYLYSPDTEAGTMSWFGSGNIAAFNSGSITSITASENTSERVFFGLDNGQVVVVNNATSSPAGTDISSGSFPSGSVSCVAIEDGDDDHLLVTFSNYGVTSVWETTDGGTNWTAVEGNLPDMPVRWALFNPNNSDQAIIATELGVWSTDDLDGGSTIWEASNNGLANVRTDMLQIRSSDNLVVAATHGRGIFTSDIFASEHSDFTADKNTIYAEASINFTDASYKATSWEWEFGDGGISTEENPTHTYKRSGIYDVTLTINGGGDAQTKSGFIHVLPNVAVPFAAADGGDFESNTDYFGSDDLAGGIDLWERGVPGNDITTVNSGTNAWKTNLSSDIIESDYSCALFTPNFNFTESGTYTLSFRKSMAVQFANAPMGVQVQYSTDNGANWTRLGDDISGINWYERGPNSTFSMNTDVIFDRYGFSNDYTNENTEYDVSFLAGNSTVAFRLVLYVAAGYSASGYDEDGFMVDDFEISGPVNDANVNVTENDPGTHLSLNGSTDYTTLSNLSVNESFTAEMWISPTATTDGQAFLAKHDAGGNDIFKIGFNAGGIEVDLRGTTTSGGTKETGLQHLAVTVDKLTGTTSQITVYKDGVQEFQSTINEVLGDPDGLDWVIGQDWDGVGVPSDYFGGTVDELRIWNVVRTENEIRESNFLILDGLDTDLVGYWQFNENTGSATENIITSNQGTLSGTSWETSSSPVGKGNSYAATISGDGTTVLNGGLSIEFTGVSGSFDVVAFEVNNTPIGTLPEDENILDETINTPYWIIETYGAGTFTSANLTYTYGAGAFTQTNPASVHLFKRSSKASGSWGTIIAANSVNAGTGQAVFNGITSFSQTTLGTASLLPVELIEFTAEHLNNVTQLKWSTASEINNDRFEVLRSIDENQWKVIGIVSSKATSGNSNEVLDYSYNDAEPLNAKLVYYRLRQIDFDGTMALSAIEQVSFEFEDKVSVSSYPNPVADYLTIQLASPFAGNALIELTSLSGRKILSRELSITPGTQAFTINTTGMKSGIYLLNVTADGQTYSTKIVKR